MNIESANIGQKKEIYTTNNTVNTTTDSSVKFADELKECEKGQNIDKEIESEAQLEKECEPEKIINNKTSEEKVLKKAYREMDSIVKNFNQTDENALISIKEDVNLADNNIMINKDFNIQEKQDLLPQMNPNMNFSGDGQPFSSFMNNSQNHDEMLVSSAQELAEESAILSTMAENMAIANKNAVIKDSTTINNIQDMNINFNSVVMNQADVELFASLVEKGSVDLNHYTTESVEKSTKISKTLADMLVKSLEKNQPLRIDFDNNISVIIRISRDGKISADFLPSSQVAEAYLKENLPLLKQRFDENDIKYDSLNHRERKDNNKESSKKKDRNNE